MKDKNKIWLTNDEDGVRKYRTRLGTIVTKTPKDEGVHLTMTNKEFTPSSEEVSFVLRTLTPQMEPGYLIHVPIEHRVSAQMELVETDSSDAEGR